MDLLTINLGRIQKGPRPPPPQTNAQTFSGVKVIKRITDNLRRKDLFCSLLDFGWKIEHLQT